MNSSSSTTEDDCHGPAYEIAEGSAKLIGPGSAKVIGVRPAKVIASGGGECAGSAKVIGSGSAKPKHGGGHCTNEQLRGHPRGDGAGEEVWMSARRMGMHRLQELVRLHRMGKGARAVAALLKMSPNTERQYRLALAASGLLAGDVEDLPSAEALRAAVVEHMPPKVPPQQSSTVERWRTDIEPLVAKGLKPKAIYDRLRLVQITRTEVDVLGEAIRARREPRRQCGGRRNRAITRSQDAE
jgi:hypothetical protein